jgi:hypothetical protein
MSAGAGRGFVSWPAFAMRSASSVTDRLQSEGRGLQLYVSRLERLHANGEVFKADLERAYSGAYLLFFASLERALEKLFLGVLTDDLSFGTRGVRSLIQVPSEIVARQVVAGDRAYADWLPYDRRTRPRARALLSGGRPFEGLSKDDRQFLEQMGYVRNALAHGSRHALGRFRSEVIYGGPIPQSLPPGQRYPASYLRGSHASGQTRFEFHLAEAVAILRRLSK